MNDAQSARRRDLSWFALLGFLTLVTRLLFRARFLYEWDSVQYALAIEKIDILWHRPHPPGYLAFVFLARAFNAVFRDPNFAIIHLNILLSIVTVVLIHSLARKIFSFRAARLAGLLAIFSPLFWFYGDVASIYAADAFSATVIGWVSWGQFSRKSEGLIPLGAVAYGLIGGVRPSAMALLFPLWLYSLIKGAGHRKAVWVASRMLFALLGVLAWFVPTVLSAGGPKPFFASWSGLGQGGFDKIILLFGSLSRYVFVNLANAFVWLLHILGLLGIPVMLYALLKPGRNRIPLTERQRRTAIFFSLWIFPPLAFYGVFFLDKAGYLLTIMPAAIIALSWSFDRLKGAAGRGFRRFGSGLIIAHILLCSAWFAVPAFDERNPLFAEFPGAVFKKPPMSIFNWDVSSREISRSDRLLKRLLDVFGKDNAHGFSPSNTMFVSRDISPNWRQLGYYLPEYLSAWPVDTEVHGLAGFGAEAYFAKDHRVGSHSGLPFWIKAERAAKIEVKIPGEIERIVWFVPRASVFYAELAEKKLVTRRLELPDLPDPVGWYEFGPQDRVEIRDFAITRAKR